MEKTMKTMTDTDVSNFFRGNDQEEIKLLTDKEVATMLGIRVEFLRQQRVHGHGIPFIKLGKAVRYAKSTVMNYLENNTYLKTPGYSKVKSK